VSGAIAGLVAITPACGFVSVGGALFIGFAAGVACFWGVSWLKNLFGYDDALDVWACTASWHSSAILTGVFAWRDRGHRKAGSSMESGPGPAPARRRRHDAGLVGRHQLSGC